MPAKWNMLLNEKIKGVSRMKNQNSPYHNNHRQFIRKRRNRNLLISFFVFVVAVAFYFFITYTSNIQTPPSQLDDSSGHATDSSSVSSTPAAPSSESPVSQPESTVSEPSAESRIENQVTLKNAAKPLMVKVNIDDQMVVVYDAEGKVVQNFICSTGKEGDDTPVGTYTVKERGESFFSKQYQEGAYYWTQFQGDFLFHSVPFDKDRNFEPEEAAKLGSKASHGCVRLALENAKWIYDNIPRGTKIVIA